jgi:hypothetical protein
MRNAIGAIILCAATTAAANTSHHHSGGGGGGESECIRWEPIPVDMAGSDMAVVDMSSVDGGSDGSDGGAPPDMAQTSLDPHAGMRCVERAGLFNCAYGHGGGNGAHGLVALLTVAALTLARARRRARG